MKEIRKLSQEIYDLVENKWGYTPDSRYGSQSWIKTVTAVNGKSNGYCFEGDFLGKGDIEIEIKYTVFLAKTQSGSRNGNSGDYFVILMDDLGKLHCTDFGTDDRSPGWALRLRDTIRSLIEKPINLGDKSEKMLNKKGQWLLGVIIEADKKDDMFAHTDDIKDLLTQDSNENDLWVWDQKESPRIEPMNESEDIPDALKDETS